MRDTNVLPKVWRLRPVGNGEVAEIQHAVDNSHVWVLIDKAVDAELVKRNVWMPLPKFLDDDPKKASDAFAVGNAENDDMRRPLVAPLLLPPRDGLRHFQSDTLDRRRDEAIAAFAASSGEAIADRLRAPLDWKVLNVVTTCKSRSCVLETLSYMMFHASVTFSRAASTSQRVHCHFSPLPSSQRANQSRAASERSLNSGASKGNLSSDRLISNKVESGLGGLLGENRTRHVPVQEEVKSSALAKARMFAKDKVVRVVPNRRFRRPSVDENEETIRAMTAFHRNGLAIEFERTHAHVRLL
mgnify:CR=1 FL=1